MNKNAINLVMALGLAFLYAVLSGLIWFAGYGLFLDKYGVGNDEDLQRLILYTIIIFLSIFLIAFNKERDDFE